MLRSTLYTLIVLLIMCTSVAIAQCPVNIGFEMGDFTNWTGYTGTFRSVTGGNGPGVLSLPTQGIVSGRHTIITRASQQKDYYANFPIASPNGSSYVVKLGNEITGAQAESLTYTFTVPPNNDQFSLIYYYALVLEDPPNGSHTNENKPKFTAKVFDVTANKYTDCGSFNFVSISTLPGFTKAPQQSAANDVYYKNWSPVTIDLRGYAGKTLRLEFTTNDCAPGGHFGYAYIDINQNCTSPISGNLICDNNPNITLTAPSGFKEYYWYKDLDFTKVISTTNAYTVAPAPPIGTQYSVRIVPYPGIGCEDTVSTIVKNADKLALNVKSKISVCKGQPANLKADSITAGSDSAFTFKYCTDAACTNFIPDPTNITTAGTYYIQAVAGCTYVKPVEVAFLPVSALKITNPPEVCGGTVDITDTAITAGSLNLLNMTYWRDAAATLSLSLSEAKTINKSGTYYIKSSNSIGCYDMQPVTVLINDMPQLQTNATEGCDLINLTAPAITKGSLPGATYTYWTDANATIPLAHPDTVTVSNTYYIKATTPAGCWVIKPVAVAIYPYPTLNVTNPPAVTFPETVDITQTFTPQTGTIYSYYLDSLTTRLIPYPTKIGKRGTYYIKALNGSACSVTFPVKVTINKPPDVDFGTNTFTPNGDNINDVFHIKIPVSMKLKSFRVYGPWGGLLFETADSNKGWDGTYNGKKLSVGTYYWIFEAYDTYLNQNVKKSGSISIVM